MGTDKLLLPWGAGGATVIEAVLSAWQASAVDAVVVVVRRAQRELIELCRHRGAVPVILGTDPPEMKDSVAAGLRHIAATLSPSTEDRWLLAPADMPELQAAVVNKLLAAHQPSAPVILVPTYQGKRGHPVLFPWPLGAFVATLGPMEGVNALLQRHPVREVPVHEPAVVNDLDTPFDYRRRRAMTDRELE